MASLVLGAVGAFIGPSVGISSAVGYALGSLAGDALFPTKQPAMSDVRSKDLQVQSSAYGAAIPVVYGSVRVGGNVVWATDLVERSSSKRVRVSKSRKVTVTTYTYFANLAIVICEGPNIQVRACWANGVLLWNGGNTPAYAVVYSGGEFQTPDPTMQSILGVANTPAYRGKCYIVFHEFPLKDFNNRTPSFTFEVISGTYPVSVSYIVADIAAKVGLVFPDIVTYDLPYLIDGFVLSQPQPAADAIQILQKGLFFGAVESQDKVIFKKRQNANSVVTIPFKELVVSSG